MPGLRRIVHKRLKRKENRRLKRRNNGVLPIKNAIPVEVIGTDFNIDSIRERAWEQRERAINSRWEDSERWERTMKYNE